MRKFFLIATGFEKTKSPCDARAYKNHYLI
jgi:hypothetical protein